LPETSRRTARGLCLVMGPQSRRKSWNSFRLQAPNGETFIFTHVDDGASEFQCDIFIEVGGIKTGTGRQHLHPDADEEFIVKEGKLKLMVDGEWRMLAPGERCLVQRGVPHRFRNGHEGETLFTTRFTPARQFLRFFLNMSLNTANHPEWYDERGEPPLVLRALALHAFAGHGMEPESQYGFRRCCLPR
jgi:quercetin dioxygenase-like cupin family protein